MAAHHLAFQGQDVKGGKPALNQKMPHKYQVEQKFLKKYVTLSLYCNMYIYIMYIYILQYIVTLYMDERVMSKSIRASMILMMIIYQKRPSGDMSLPEQQSLR